MLSSQQEDRNKSAKLSHEEEKQNHFLLEKYKELQQKVDNIQMQKENSPQGWMSPSWIRLVAPQLPVLASQTVQPTMMNQILLQWNQPQGRVQASFQGEHPVQNLCQYPAQIQM